MMTDGNILTPAQAEPTAAQHPPVPDTPNQSAETSTEQQAVPIVPEFKPFPLTGNNINPLIDTSGELISLYIRLRQGYHVVATPELYEQIQQCMQETSQVLHELGRYDQVSQLAWRYCLCLCLDEALIQLPASEDKLHTQHNLTHYFHCQNAQQSDELYAVIYRLLRYPETYRDVLECCYLLLQLGYNQGHPQYRLQRQEAIEAIRKALEHYWIDASSGYDAYRNVLNKPFRSRVQLPKWPIYLATILILSSVYLIFYHWLSQDEAQLATKLEELGTSSEVKQ